MEWERLEGRVRDADCELCAEDRFTEWFHEDDDCWIAECDACSVPMIVWRNHSAAPDDEVRAALHQRLREVVADHFVDEFVIDDRLRSIPTHYHAHARPAGRWGGGLRRRGPGSLR